MRKLREKACRHASGQGIKTAGHDKNRKTAITAIRRRALQRMHAGTIKGKGEEVIEMMEIGRICTKIAGRDAGKNCIIIDTIDGTFVMVDGYTRRKKVNIKHLEPSKDMADIKKNASHEDVIAALEKLGMKEKKKKAPLVRKEKKPVAEKKTPEKKASAKKHAPKKA